MSGESKILVVEDRSRQQPLLKDILSRGGYSVITAGKGEAVLELARKEVPHIIIGDATMPFMRGFDMCRNIKNDNATRDIPLILRTRLAHVDEFIQALNAGADYYITEPCSNDSILSMVTAVIEQHLQVVNRPEEKATDILVDGSYLKVSCSRGQILTLLYSLHENAISSSRELDEKRGQLARVNAEFEVKIAARTKALEKREKRYRALFDNMLNGFAYHEIIVDGDGIPVDYIFLEVNDAFERLTGLMSEDIIGKRVTQALPGIVKEDFDWIGTYGKVALEGEPARFISYTKELDRWYSVLAYSPEKGKFAIIFEDFGDYKKAEDKINKLNQELEEKVKERTEELEAAVKDLEGFSYSVSHDLRAPLRAIDGFSRILLEEYSHKVDEEGQRYLSIVRDNANRMGRLIDDILNFSRMGRKEINICRINMKALADDIFNELKSAAPERKISFKAGKLPAVFGDRPMIRQVLTNLLSNAVKFTRTRDLAIIEMAGKIEGEEKIYSIKDNGVGFDMDYKDKLFGVFQRLHGVEEFEGTGAGLSIVKRIIEKHGGRIWAEGKTEEGATFYFSLPRER